MEPEDAVAGGTGTGGVVVRAGGTEVEDVGTLGVGRDVVEAVVDGGVVIEGGGMRSGVVVGGGKVGDGLVVVVAAAGGNGDAEGSVVSVGGVTGCLFCITNQPPKPSITSVAMT